MPEEGSPITATQTGFTDVIGTVMALVDNDSSTAWQPQLYSDSTGHEIIVDMAAWFDVTTLSRVDIGVFGTVMTWGGFGIQLSSDGTDWYNMPDNTSSFILGEVGSVTFTPMATAFTARYIKLKGTGGACATPPGGEKTLFTLLAYLQADGTPLVLGSNTNPFTGTPDTDPLPPAGSTATTRVSGVAMQVLRRDTVTARVSGVAMQVLHQDNPDAFVSGVALMVLRTIDVAQPSRSFGLIVG